MAIRSTRLLALLLLGLSSGCSPASSSTSDSNSTERAAHSPDDLAVQFAVGTKSTFAKPVAYNAAGGPPNSPEPAPLDDNSVIVPIPVVPAQSSTQITDSDTVRVPVPAFSPQPSSSSTFNNQAPSNSSASTTAPQTVGAQSNLNSTSTPNANASPAATGEFQPPFAERTDLFSPPASSPATNDNEQSPQVEAAPGVNVSLKGFARVQDQRVLLMIEDSIAPLSEGAEKHGVRVIKIDPPHVTLSRDDQQWTLSLTNQFAPSDAPRPGKPPGHD